MTKKQAPIFTCATVQILIGGVPIPSIPPTSPPCETCGSRYWFNTDETIKHCPACEETAEKEIKS